MPKITDFSLYTFSKENGYWPPIKVLLNNPEYEVILRIECKFNRCSKCNKPCVYCDCKEQKNV